MVFYSQMNKIDSDLREIVRNLTKQLLEMTSTYEETKLIKEKQLIKVNTIKKQLDTATTQLDKYNKQLEWSMYQKQELSKQLDDKKMIIKIKEDKIKKSRDQISQHMYQYKDDKWAKIHEYSFGYDPFFSEEGLQYINDIVNLDVCNTCRKQIIDWISINKNLVENAVKNKGNFIEFIIRLRNIVAVYTGDEILPKKEILKLYNISQ